MPKVTMSLTPRDVENTEALRTALDARSNAQAVSIALSLTSFVVEKITQGNELCLMAPNGDLQRIIMRELMPIQRMRVEAD